MKKLTLYFGAFLTFLTFASLDVHACSCLQADQNQSIAQQVNIAKKDAQAVFSGKVLEIVKNPENFEMIVKFQVQSSWKGGAAKLINVTTATDSAMCGYNFVVGKSYLVYASGANSKNLQAGICSRTAELKTAKADVKALGRAKIMRRT